MPALWVRREKIVIMSAPEPAVPRPAASVLLVREGASDRVPIEVYMIRRNKSMRFLGGYYAFPGGKVDVIDAHPAILARVHGITAAEAARSFAGGDEPPAIAYWITAARELLEETGVLLACDASGRAVEGGDEEEIAACRHELMHGTSFVEALARRDWHCDLRALRYLSHFVTPPRSPIRFSARFFVSALPGGQAPRLYTEETSEGFWIAPGEAYWRFVDDEMAMAEPAEYALAYLAQFDSLADLWQAHADRQARFEGISHRSDGADETWKQWRFPYRG
jgi:8-oxo-dGTP pyrophosphatase MutT (NUDIX family)